MIATPAGVLQARAGALATRVPGAAAVPLSATLGGGSLPGETLPSFGLALAARSAARLLAALRAGAPAVVGRIEDGRVVLDLRAVDPASDDALAGALAVALRSVGGPR
jgi:L-seryl-tRNA(Ser) seleniumtransferase